MVVMTNSDDGADLADAIVELIGGREGWPGPTAAPPSIPGITGARASVRVVWIRFLGERTRSLCDGDPLTLRFPDPGRRAERGVEDHVLHEPPAVDANQVADKGSPINKYRLHV